MKIVIQCAARKRPGAPSFLTSDGKAVFFVGHPESAPASAQHVYARPDDVSDTGRTWRERLRDHNGDAADNRLNLLPAFELYSHDAYRALVARFGLERVFILSAGWGLIPAGFLTPHYDITFSASAESWKRRRAGDVYDDFRIMPDDGADIIFLGGKDYLPLFCNLTAALRGSKIVFFNAARSPDLPAGFQAVRYSTTTRTNWHYGCARDLIAGRIAPA